MAQFPSQFIISLGFLLEIPRPPPKEIVRKNLT